MQPQTKVRILRFGVFELDLDAQLLLREGRIVRLQPQPFKLLCLLAESSGKVVSREEIRSALWSGDTFVDFDQGVNFAIRQIRDSLGEEAEHPVYIQTVPRRGYRFLAPVTAVTGDEVPSFESASQHLSKAMWANILELQLAERKRTARQAVLKRALIVTAAVAVGLAVVVVILLMR
jgi:DNA-binding winged helix-turn-helix (wHTH) protein